MSVYRKCSRCRSPKGPPIDWYAISDLCHHLFRVYRLLKYLKYRSLNNNLGHILLQSLRAASFLKGLVQGCFLRRWSSPGVPWPHFKVSSSSDSPVALSQCLHAPHTPGFVTSYAGLVTVRAFLGLVEGPLYPGITLLLSSFYTRKELAFRYVAGFLFWPWSSLHWLSRIALFSSTAAVGCELLSQIFPPQFHPVVQCFFRFTFCCNREHEWHWWKTRMGLDLHSCTFWNIFQFVAIFNHSIGRIVHDFRRHYWFLFRAFYTTRFPIFIWKPERVSL